MWFFIVKNHYGTIVFTSITIQSEKRLGGGDLFNVGQKLIIDGLMNGEERKKDQSDRLMMRKGKCTL